LIGADIEALLAGARAMAGACGPSIEGDANPALVLGAALGDACLAGRDKATFVASRSLASLPVWIEQLVAESTGKSGRGIVPVVDEPLGPPQSYGGDRIFVHLALRSENDEEAETRLGALEEAGHPVLRIEMESKAELGAEFFRWEMATAAAGSLLGVHPFDQPDVELAKKLARAAMEAGAGDAASDSGAVASEDGDLLVQAANAWLGQVRPGDYIAVQAYLAPRTAEAGLRELGAALRERSRAAVTTGYGPRFLHSTGQLHKGGPNSGLFLQIVDEPEEQVPIPETSYTFAALIRAQALGDAGALRERGRRLLRVNARHDAKLGLDRLAAAVRAQVTGAATTSAAEGKR
jgi:transaldolase/glucose-6-phosphate isomerase